MHPGGDVPCSCSRSCPPAWAAAPDGAEASFGIPFAQGEVPVVGAGPRWVINSPAWQFRTLGTGRRQRAVGAGGRGHRVPAAASPRRSRSRRRGPGRGAVPRTGQHDHAGHRLGAGHGGSRPASTCSTRSVGARTSGATRSAGILGLDRTAWWCPVEPVEVALGRTGLRARVRATARQLQSAHRHRGLHLPHHARRSSRPAGGPHRAQHFNRPAAARVADLAGRAACQAPTPGPARAARRPGRPRHRRAPPTCMSLQLRSTMDVTGSAPTTSHRSD